MINFNKKLQYFCFKIIVFVLFFISGCVRFDSSLPPVGPSFQFTESEPQTGLVAFSVICTGVKNQIRVEVINVDTNKPNLLFFDCDPKEGYRQIEILKIPAGYYTFGSIKYYEKSVNNYHYTKEKNHFYFNIEKHRLNYIGRLEYKIDGSRLFTAVSNEGIADLPEIKIALPEVPLKYYNILFWEKNEFGDLIAKYPTSTPVLPDTQKKDTDINYKKFKTTFYHKKSKS